MKNKNLGKEAKDKITGFKGLIIGHAEYLTGCDQYLVIPKCIDSDDKYPDGQWFDEGRLEIKKVIAIKQQEVLAEDDGCDCIAPKK